jgi:D-amino-acid oxidase
VSGPPVAVVGAGIIGLTTAIRLAEAGHVVTIVTADDPVETTSVLASAMVGPSFAGPPAATWANVSDAVFRGADRHAPGVSIARGRLIAEPEGFIHPKAADLPGFAPCTPHDTPVGFGTAFWVEVPLVDMTKYIPHLVERAHDLGIRVERAHLRTLDDVNDGGQDVVNCAGLGARDLVPDPAVTPLRGPKIVATNPGVDTFLVSGPPSAQLTSYHPHGDVVVLGGTMTESWDTTPDPDEEAAILARCVAVEPLLCDAMVIEHRVGLRPARPEPRLEAVQSQGKRVVHNYGHGGSGVTFAWGCAGRVVRLLT